jgi:hypothetical protein
MHHDAAGRRSLRLGIGLRRAVASAVVGCRGGDELPELSELRVQRQRRPLVPSTVASTLIVPSGLQSPSSRGTAVTLAGQPATSKRQV